MLVSLPAPSKRIGEEPTAWNRPRYFPSFRCCYWLASSTAAGHYWDFSPDAASSGVPGAVLPGRARPCRSLVGGLGAHALGVFGFGGGGPWGRDWEERKTREMMDKEGGS